MSQAANPITVPLGLAKHSTEQETVPLEFAEQSTEQYSNELRRLIGLFERQVYCLMGLPIDAVTCQEAARLLRRSVYTGERCLLATPNLNFVAEAMRNSEFRDYLLRSDLATADGMPLVWLARMLGLPIRERAAGSDIFDTLRERVTGPGRIRVFFFGGPRDTARRAQDAVNASGDNLQAVGAINPGFGSVEDLSQAKFIKTINRSRAGMLVIALGAVKGHTWIKSNADRLTTPVICHLGAVVAFASKDVKRAPCWIRSAGFEWAWRVGQQPTLIRRYLRDAIDLMPFFLFRTLPYIAWHRAHSALAQGVRQQTIHVQVSDDNTVELRLGGDFTSTHSRLYGGTLPRQAFRRTGFASSWMASGSLILPS